MIKKGLFLLNSPLLVLPNLSLLLRANNTEAHGVAIGARMVAAPIRDGAVPRVVAPRAAAFHAGIARGCADRIYHNTGGGVW